MEFIKKYEDKLVVIIQLIVVTIAACFAIKNSGRDTSANAKKLSKMNTKQQAKLMKMQYKNDKKQLKKQLKAQQVTETAE